VVLVPGAEAALAVTLSNAGGELFPYCLDVLRPGQPHHAPGSLGAGCGPPGERLALRTPEPGFIVSDPFSFTMTPDGRLFAADLNSRNTVEYTADLAYVRHFEHPRVAHLSPFASTGGITYDARTGTLWWLNIESSGFDRRRTMLLEGTLAGVATGRRITLQVPTGLPPAPGLIGGVFEPAAGRFYAINGRTGVTHALWAVDTMGAVVSGYPLALQRYPEAEEGNGLDVHGGQWGADEVRIEVPVGLPGEGYFRRVVMTDPVGRDLGLETPIAAFPAGWRAGLRGTALRSRLDPNGVMFGAFAGFDAQNLQVVGLFAWRPVPLAPSWLSLSAWMGSVGTGGTAQVTLTLRAEERPPGEYRSTLVVEDTAGAVVASVPLTLVVEAGTPAEPSPEAAGAALAVSPNPVGGASAVVTITLPAAAAAARVAVFDVLGRQAGLLHQGPLPAGATPLVLDAAALPAGVYIVRASGADLSVARSFTVR
jgi:hypothetical protein